MSALNASEMRSPFIANNVTKRVIAWSAEPGLHEQNAELVALQPEGP